MFSYLGEETSLHLTMTSFQVVLERTKVSPSSVFVQTTPTPSAAPHKSCVPDPFPALLLCSGCAPALPCLSCHVVRDPKFNAVISQHPCSHPELPALSSKGHKLSVFPESQPNLPAQADVLCHLTFSSFTIYPQFS